VKGERRELNISFVVMEGKIGFGSFELWRKFSGKLWEFNDVEG
jgi:hypothetical protein